MKCCPNCGYKADDNMLYCIECGERLLDVSAPDKKKEKRKKSIRFISAACFLFLAFWYARLAVKGDVGVFDRVCQAVLSLSFLFITISLLCNKPVLSTVGGCLVVAYILCCKTAGLLFLIKVFYDDIIEVFLDFLILWWPEFTAFILLSMCGIARRASGITGILAGILVIIIKSITYRFWGGILITTVDTISTGNILIFAVGAALLGIAFHERKPKKAVNSNNT